MIRAIDWLGPDRADSVPLPLLILGGLGLLLTLAAAGSKIARHLQSRRTAVQPAPAVRPGDPR